MRAMFNSIYICLSFPMTTKGEVGTEKTNESVPVNCTGYNSSGPTNCSFYMSWAEPYFNESVNVGSSLELYTGRVCSRQLAAWQECALGRITEDIYVDSKPEQYTQAERERDAAHFLYFLREVAN